MLLGSIFYAIKQWKLVSGGLHGQGTVIDIAEKEGGQDDSTVYAAVVKFTAEDGNEYTFTSGMSSSIAPRIGSTRKIVYDRSNPAKAEVDSFFVLWFGPFLLAFMGIAFTFTGLVAKPPRPSVTADPSPGTAASSGATTAASGSMAPALPPALVNRAFTALSQGQDKQTIKQILIAEGWNPNDVDRVLE